jgi:hypothetical protein
MVNLFNETAQKIHSSLDLMIQTNFGFTSTTFVVDSTSTFSIGESCDTWEDLPLE